MTGFTLKDPGTRELTGGDLLAQSLKNIGVEVAFGLHGGHLDAFLMGCEFSGIRLVDTRHETVAVQAAEAYAKLTSKIGVCFVTANSGFSNGIPGLATALADRDPILCITSSPPLRDAENNSLQGIIDQVVVSRPLTKFAHRMTNPEDTPRIISLAVRTALSGAPGPVLVDFPIDVLFSPVHRPLISWGSISSPLAYGPGAHTGAVQAAADLLSSAKRPVIITGTGVSSAAGAEVVKFSTHSGIPIFHSPKGRMHVASTGRSHDGGSAGKLALLGDQKPDLVLLLGARTGMFLGLRSGAIIPRENCKLVQVDVDGGEIGRTLPVDLGVVSDVGQFVAALHSKFDPALSRKFDSDWIQKAISLKETPFPFENEPETQPSGRLHPYHALKHVFSSIEPESIVIMDGGEASGWAGDVAHLCAPSVILTSTGNLGFLGNGFGYALGAAVAAPDRQVVMVHGDGSAGFHFMELDTFKRMNLNILTVVVNNYCWGMSSNGQQLVYGDNNPARPVSSLSPVAEYDLVAKALGNASAKLDKIDAIAETVKRLQKEIGPSCVNLIVDDKPIHPMTTAMVGQTDDPGMVVVPYYDNIPRAYYKL
ncbi:thiamine diphosphate-binding protein [Aspergillus steynii IBT 23096]|uniref:Thiamine diphosphate-binding protein n=1 Tax=Aspergillus steynii IBT 23096 TaxID=1392250 RepID=A0A2I2G861_9EURO|nr:thiamine diphosphate-binding protein [Aspergillus steynii IBT 23096]PLB49055.1 thiamine diphosphate-binding protein [Aspergillus steynii IBT 23096]